MLQMATHFTWKILEAQTAKHLLHSLGYFASGIWRVPEPEEICCQSFFRRHLCRTYVEICVGKYWRNSDDLQQQLEKVLEHLLKTDWTLSSKRC